MNDTNYNVLELIETRKSFPGLDNFHTLVSNEYDNFIYFFDLSWFNYLTTRDAIVSYAVILGQLSKKLQREYFSTTDDFLLWYNICLDYSISETTVKYLLRSKMYIYHFVRPLRVLFEKKNKVIYSADHQLILEKFKNPLYLLKYTSEIAHVEGYMAALKFIKKFTRITQSLNISIEKKLDKSPVYFVERLSQLVNKKAEPEISIQDIIIDCLGKYINLPHEKLIQFDDYNIQEYFEIDNKTFEMILYSIHQNLRLDTDPSYNYIKLKTINDLNIYFTGIKKFNIAPPDVIFDISEDTTFISRIRKLFNPVKQEFLRLKLIKYDPVLFLYDNIATNPLAEMLKQVKYKFNKLPKKAKQIYLLSINNQVPPLIFDNKYSKKAKSFASRKNYQYIYYDNASFILELLFTQFITNWITSELDPQNTEFKHFKRSRSDFISHLYSLGLSEDKINFIEKVSIDSEQFHIRRILRRLKRYYELKQTSGYHNLHKYSLYIPYDILERFYIFIYIEIINEVKLLEKACIVKMYLNDWLLIYFRLLNKWSIMETSGSKYKINDFTLHRALAVMESFNSINSRICHYCSEKNSINSSYCENCGKNIIS